MCTHNFTQMSSYVKTKHEETKVHNFKLSISFYREKKKISISLFRIFFYNNNNNLGHLNEIIYHINNVYGYKH